MREGSRPPFACSIRSVLRRAERPIPLKPTARRRPWRKHSARSIPSPFSCFHPRRLCPDRRKLKSALRSAHQGIAYEAFYRGEESLDFVLTLLKQIDEFFRTSTRIVSDCRMHDNSPMFYSRTPASERRYTSPKHHARKDGDSPVHSARTNKYLQTGAVYRSMPTEADALHGWPISSSAADDARKQQPKADCAKNALMQTCSHMVCSCIRRTLLLS